jgi:hypothetical protein
MVVEQIDAGRELELGIGPGPRYLEARLGRTPH